MDGGGSSADADEIYATVRSTSSDDVAMILDGAQRVVIVPGYGMAVAQRSTRCAHGQGARSPRHQSRVCYPSVAGRMPGHMNVLLAEADVPYEQLLEMDQINPTLETVDVAIVIGANDVVNPVARTDPDSPIAGMPIIDVDKCRTVIVIKRSLSPGFAQIPNPVVRCGEYLDAVRRRPEGGPGHHDRIEGSVAATAWRTPSASARARKNS